MKETQIIELINKGEGINIEFKESKHKLNRDVSESVCAFLNRNGGHLFLGVGDDGTILGVDEYSVDKIKDSFVTSINNPNKISPTFYLSVKDIKIKGKTILYIFIPESSQVHRCNGRIYDRNEDGDFDITNNTNLVAGLYLRKQSTYSENMIFPAVEISELKDNIFIKVKRLASNQRINHPWGSMGKIELLKSAGFYLKDLQSGKEGITLAGILIFGTDQLIFNAVPHFKTDAILRVENLDRYDDRDDIRTNLIDSYERLMQFVAKHLNDKFYLEGDQRINIRERIFREVGWAEELGSGIRNVLKYNRIYSGAEAQFIEGDVFKTIIPLVGEENEEVYDPEREKVDRETAEILEFCRIPRSRKEIQDFLVIKGRTRFNETVLNPLINGGLLHPTHPDKPTSPNQKYYSTNTF